MNEKSKKKNENENPATRKDLKRYIKIKLNFFQYACPESFTSSAAEKE